MSDERKIGDQITVVGMVDRQPHRCIVTELIGYKVRARDDQMSDAYYERYDEEEGINWARGWDTTDAKALLAQLALENSR